MPTWDPWNTVVTCLPYRAIMSRGIFLGDNPFFYSHPVLMMQMSLCSISTATFDFILRPLGLCSFFSQLMGAIFIGPLGVLRYRSLNDFVFSYHSLYVFETFANFGTMFFFFIVGLKMDMDMVIKSGRRGLTIGFTAFFAPLIISVPFANLMKVIYRAKDPILADTFPIVAVNSSEISFHVIICVLADLKLLNTEMGRLAMSSSIISNALVSGTGTLVKAVYDSIRFSSLRLFTLRVGSVLIMLLIIVFLLRPIMFWMIKRTPEGSEVRQVYVFGVFWMVLLTAFIGHATGLPVHLGPVLLGLAVPVGPPLGTTIEHKLEAIVQHVLVPLFYIASAARIDLSTIHPSCFFIVELIILLAYLGKFIGTVLSSIYCDVSLQDALALGLVMVSQGVFDIIQFRRNLVFGVLQIEVYSLMVCTALVLAGITSPLVKFMYRPSKRYMGFKRSIQHNIQDDEFRILACAYYESNAPTIMNLLQASNPTNLSPIHLYLLHLIELQRITIPILIAHKRSDYSSIHYNRSKNIINAFRSIEEQSHGRFSVSSFTAMSPFATMHDDICTLAVDKKTSLIILPFHRQVNLDGIVESIHPIRNVNRTVLTMAPCSVGILVDRGQTRATIMGAHSFYHVAVVFLGGADDREVLTYGMRMAEYPYTALTVIHFHTGIGDGDELMNEFRQKYVGNKRVEYREEVVESGIGMIQVFKSMEESYDLMIVGRQHNRDSPLVQGLTEWNEFPELGLVGDMLATSDSRNPLSVLVLQQHYYTNLLRSPSSVFMI